MTSYVSFKYRIYPNLEQQKILGRNFGAKRWIFNHFLAENQRRYREGEPHLNAYGCNYEITKLKQYEETSWLVEIDDWCLKNAAADLANAYQNFWNSLKGKSKAKSKFPKFKNKNSRQSYKTTLSTKKVPLESGYIKLPKIPKIKIKYHRPIEGEIKSIVVSKTPSGKYFVSILCKHEREHLPKTGLEVGIDLGLKDLAILSSEIKFEHPERILAKPKQKLKNSQKKLSRMKVGSRRFRKQKLRVAKNYEKVTNVRNAYYHNLASWIVNTYDNIYLEDLNVKGMIKNRRLSRKIHESAWSTFKGFLQTKAAMYGKGVYEVDRFFASSKLCSSCGEKHTALSLKDREWTCLGCGTIHDRDWNASINILQEGQRIVYGQIITAVETTVAGSNVPMSLTKFANKIERSVSLEAVGIGTRESLVALATR